MEFKKFLPYLLSLFVFTFFAFFAFFTLLAFLPLAKEARAMQTLTWQDCIQIATQNNASIQTALSNVESNEYQTKAAHSQFLPQLSANVGYNRNSSSSSPIISQSSGIILGGNTNLTSSYTTSITGTQNLFNGFQDIGKINQAQANTRVQQAALQLARAQISYDLKNYFENLTYANEYQKLTQEIIRRREENVKLVEIRFDNGRENKGSLLLSKAYLNQAKYNDLQAKNARRVAQAQLARVLGWDDYVDYEITGEIPIHEAPSSRPDFRELASQTPDLSQVQAQEESANAAITVARSQLLPSLSLTGTVAQQGSDLFSSTSDRWSAGVSLSFPFFNGGRDFYGLKSSVASLKAVTHNRENTNRQVYAKLQQMYANYIEAVTKLQMDSSFREAATVRAEIARARYNNGLMTFEDWDVIENDLISRQTVYLQSKRDRVISEAAWEQAQGKGILQ